jgi:hypothetical protein
MVPKLHADSSRRLGFRVSLAGETKGDIRRGSGNTDTLVGVGVTLGAWAIPHGDGHRRRYRGRCRSGGSGPDRRGVAAVYHAEVVAHRVGEPFGTLVLAVAVTVIEVALIVSSWWERQRTAQAWRATRSSPHHDRVQRHCRPLPPRRRRAPS